MMDDCQKCGACCLYQLIEVSPNDPNLQVLKDLDLIVPHEDGFRMRHKWNRCAALKGEIGKNVTCSIYENRPQVCRDYQKDSLKCTNMVFISITRFNKPLFTGDPESWPKRV